MCLIVLAIEQRIDLPLLIVANRDEFYERPTQAAHFWRSHPSVFAGRDQRATGTWMAVDITGRFAAVTNIRDDGHDLSAQSRGSLITRFLQSGLTPANWLDRHISQFHHYNGFNLLVGDRKTVWFANNRGDAPRPLSRGIYGVSNATLDTPWDKVTQSKSALAKLMQQVDPPSVRDCLALLNDKTDSPASRSQALDRAFVKWTDYGTRCTTVVARDAGLQQFVTEQSWDSNAQPTGLVSVKFQLSDV